jgi:hypothetical protein
MTSVHTIEQLAELFDQQRVEVREAACLKDDNGEIVERMVAPLVEGEKIAFHLGETLMRDICEHYKLEIVSPHEGVEMLVVNVCLDAESVRVLKDVNDSVKAEFRKLAGVHCPLWTPLVRTYKGVQTLAVDLLLDAEAPTQLLFHTPTGFVEGEGMAWLLTQLDGNLDNLKGFTCNVVLEFDWITQKGDDHRMHVKAHSAVFLKKAPPAPVNRTLKRSAESLDALCAANSLPQATKRR